MVIFGRIAMAMFGPLSSIRGIDQVTWDVLKDIFFIIAVLVLIIAFFGMVREVHFAHQLDAFATRTSAEITGKWISHSVDTTDYCVAYKYRNDQEVGASLNRSEYNRLEIGDQVSVFYLPDTPHISRIDRSAPPFVKR
jgi:hypothetical protein